MNTISGLARADLVGPVAIGGVGGSGTRVVAQLLSEAGFYVGGDLNDALDNRWFTLLFKRPDWYERSLRPGNTSFQDTARAFVDVMTQGRRGALVHLPLILRAATEMSRTGHDSSGFGTGSWPFRRVATMLAMGAASRQSYVGWGWKEPNTHLFLPELAAAMPGLRYIHVLRHGLDMAFSANQHQLYNFGWMVTDRGRRPETTPEASVDFWIAANQRALTLGPELLGDRFTVVNMDTLWRDAAEKVAKLIVFLGVETDEAVLERLAKLPGRPASAGRYRDHDLGCFSRAQLDAIEALGFEVNGRPRRADQS